MELRIESLAYGGDSVAHLPDGRTAFVYGGCPGDVVEAELTAEHPRYVNARTVRVVSPSADRVDPPCPYFGECGGCQWQHVVREPQLEAKRSAVHDSLRRIGRIAKPAVRDCVPSRDQYGYRNKVELRASEARGRLILGFARVGSTDIMPIAACLLLPDRARELPGALQGALRYLSGRSASGLGISRVTLRVAAHTRALEVALWTAPGPFPRHAAAKTIIDATGADSVVRVLAKGDPAARDVVGVEVLAGRGHWIERLSGRKFAVSAPTFFQVNTPTAEDLAAVAVEAADPGGLAVLDAYAGAGTFTLPLAQSADMVYAIESSRHALADLRRNVEGTRGESVRIVPGDAARVVPELGPIGVALVDPPRAGLQAEALDALLTAGPERLVYVSCNPTTLARDAAALADARYALAWAQPVDLFPQTYHVETIALFLRG